MNIAPHTLSLIIKRKLGEKEIQRALYVKDLLLLIVGGIGLILPTMMFGEIGIAAAIGSISAILTGIEFLKLNKQLELQMK